jgi:recombination protein RecA
MAKKKADAPLKQGETSLDRLRTMFGDDIAITAADVVAEVPEITSLTPTLDVALGGGIPTGSFVTVVGPSGCGKTSTIIQFCKNWQKRKRKIYYFATELRINPRDFGNISKLNAAQIDIIRSTEEHILTAEEQLQAADIILRNEKYALVVMDSFSMIADAEDMGNNDYKQGKPAAVNRMISSFAKNMTPVIPINHNIMIGVFHTYANIGGKTAMKSSIPSKAEFFRSVGINCKWAEPIKVGSDDAAKQIGQINHWVVERTMLPGGMTGAKADSILKYGKGIDVNGELVAMAKPFGLISQSASWYQMAFMGKDGPKFQGEEKAIAYLDENPKEAEKLHKRLMELIA